MNIKTSLSKHDLSILLSSIVIDKKQFYKALTDFHKSDYGPLSAEIVLCAFAAYETIYNDIEVFEDFLEKLKKENYYIGDS